MLKKMGGCARLKKHGVVLCWSYNKGGIVVIVSQAMSPDGEAIVTGAGDETLRFWNVFSKTRSTKVSQQSETAKSAGPA